MKFKTVSGVEILRSSILSYALLVSSKEPQFSSKSTKSDHALMLKTRLPDFSYLSLSLLLGLLQAYFIISNADSILLLRMCISAQLQKMKDTSSIDLYCS